MRITDTDPAEQLPAFEDSLPAILYRAKETVVAPMRPKLREFNITEPQWRVMRVLADRMEVDAGVLSEVGLLHVPSVTRILKDLEERGLIVRRIDPDDRRRTLVALTADGRCIYKNIVREVRRVQREFVRRFGAERMARLINEMAALSAVIKGVH